MAALPAAGEPSAAPARIGRAAFQRSKAALHEQMAGALHDGQGWTQDPVRHEQAFRESRQRLWTTEPLKNAVDTQESLAKYIDYMGDRPRPVVVPSLWDIYVYIMRTPDTGAGIDGVPYAVWRTAPWLPLRYYGSSFSRPLTTLLPSGAISGPVTRCWCSFRRSSSPKPQLTCAPGPTQHNHPHHFRSDAIGPGVSTGRIIRA